jgi:hypothetical protein
VVRTMTGSVYDMASGWDGTDPPSVVSMMPQATA